MIFTLLASFSMTFSISVVAGDDLEHLLNRCQNLRTSIANQRGLLEGDMEAVRTLRDDITEWNADHKELALIAAELQFTIWLGEIEEANELFEELSTLQPDNSRIALAWAEFRLEQEGLDTYIVYNELIDKFPNSSDIVLNWTNVLEDQNQFTQAIAAMENLSEEQLQDPDIALVYARLLYSDNRFSDAIDSLNNVNQESENASPITASRVATLKTTYEEALGYWEEEQGIRDVEDAAGDMPTARIFTVKGPIDLTLFEDHAPNTVANFITLASDGFYDGTKFHRVLKKFMAQGGDPNSKDGAEGNPGSGGPGYTIKDEHNGDDYRRHFAGTLSMANRSAPNTGGSQFFLTHLPTSHLDGRHTVFGRVTSGLDVVRNLEVDDVILSITITSKRDHDYTLETIGEKKEQTVKPKSPVKGNPGLTTSSQDN